MAIKGLKAEVCDKCGRPAVWICPDCGAKMCPSHSENRYGGQNRGFKSRYMCPKCWKNKSEGHRHRVLCEDMVNAKTYKPKTYVFTKK